MNSERSRQVYELRQNLNDKMSDIDKRLFEDMKSDYFREDAASDEKIKKGDYVLVKSLNQKGYVIDIDNSNTSTIQIGLLKMKAKSDELLKIQSEEEKQQTVKTNKMVKLRSKSVKPSIDLRGMNMDEAIMETDKYLDDAYLSGLNEITVIHGKGTGILREGIKQYLKSHRHVKEFRTGNFNEGGDGVTIVSFR